LEEGKSNFSNVGEGLKSGIWLLEGGKKEKTKKGRSRRGEKNKVDYWKGEINQNLAEAL